MNIITPPKKELMNRSLSTITINIGKSKINNNFDRSVGSIMNKFYALERIKNYEKQEDEKLSKIITDNGLDIDLLKKIKNQNTKIKQRMPKFLLKI